jgi:hypothetical protein
MAQATTILALWQAKDSIVDSAATLVKDFFAPEVLPSIIQLVFHSLTGLTARKIKCASQV